MTSDASAKHGLPEKLVLGLLKKMPLGKLRMEYADGTVREFGASESEVTANVKINNDEEFFKRCAYYGNVGMGEAYTDGIWDTPDIRAVISWFIYNMEALQGSDTASDKLPGVNLLKVVNWFRHLKRANTVETSRRNISEHYDLGNEFYSLWLDKTMTYSCAKFEEPNIAFEEAQSAKYEALCQKLKLKPGEHVLEIGCGWGGFGCHAAKHHGVKVTGVTISEAQAAYARKRVKGRGPRRSIRNPHQRLPPHRRPIRQDRLHRNDRSRRRQIPRTFLCQVPRGPKTRRPPRHPDDHRPGQSLQEPHKRRRLDSKSHLPRFSTHEYRPRP